MKSFVISAVVVGIASAVSSSQYFIGNYSAQGKVAGVVPYPLGVCLGTGFPAPYAIFTCNGTYVTQQLYSSTDPTCSGSFTTSTFKPSSTPGLAGYAHCSGAQSYMIIDQFLQSCANWKKGSNPVTSTTIAVEACSLYNVSNGIQFYSRSSCGGDSQTMTIYQNDNTCSNAGSIVKQTTVPLGCHFFGVQQGLKIYSAMRQCVLDGVPERCSKRLVDYSATVKFNNVSTSMTFQETYEDLFPYASVSVDNWNLTSSEQAEITLNLSFCTQWEDGHYADAISDLGHTTLNSGYLTADSVCWTCTAFDCWNSTLCGTDNYCNISTQCAKVTPSTTTMSGETTTTDSSKSATAIYVSFFALIALVLSFAMF